MILCLKKSSERYGSPGLYTPQGAEKDYRNDYWPSDQGTNVKRIEDIIVKCAI